MNLPGLALKNAEWVWDKLRQARSVGFQINEESITDFVLLNFKACGKKQVVTHNFTRQEESRNGADWEWWFVRPNGQCIGFRVQAKVINLQSNGYNQLHYKNKSGVAQTTLLIRDARKHKAIPLYCNKQK